MSSTSTTTSDLRLEVPLGSRVLVRSGIELAAPSTEDSRRSAKALAEELDRWQGTGALVLGGPLLAAGASAKRSESLDSPLGVVSTTRIAGRVRSLPG